MSENLSLPNPDESQIPPTPNQEDMAAPTKNTTEPVQEKLSPPEQTENLLGKFVLKAHPKCLLFPKKSAKEMANLKESLVLLRGKGQNPLEQPVLLLEGFILDGRHRYQAWAELAAEGACDGWFAENPPPTVEVQADDETVALRIASRNLSGRNLRADQRAAIWLKLVDETPSLRDRLAAQEKENEERMKSGKKPTDSSDQGFQTNAFLATGANVSQTVMKQVRKVQREASPDELTKLAEGKATVKGILNKLRAKSKDEVPAIPQPLAEIQPNQAVYTVQDYELGMDDLSLVKWTVERVDGGRCLFKEGDSKDRRFVFDREQADLQRKHKLKVQIDSLSHDLGLLRSALKKSPVVEKAQKRRSRPPKSAEPTADSAS